MLRVDVISTFWTVQSGYQEEFVGFVLKHINHMHGVICSHHVIRKRSDSSCGIDLKVTAWSNVWNSVSSIASFMFVS